MKHDGTEREAQRRLLPFPLSFPSPGDPMTPEMALAAAAVRGEEDVQTFVVRAGEDAWLKRSRGPKKT